MRKYFVKFAAYSTLTGRVSLALDVGRILEKRQHALFPGLRERVEVEKSIVGRRGIDLEIAGMNDHAERSVYGERNTIYQAVRDLNRVNRKRTDLESLSGGDFIQLGIVEQTVLVQLVFHVSKRELRAPDRNIQFGKNPRQRANVIFVTMSENNSTNMLAVLGQIGDVGNDNIHAEKFGFGEHEAGIDDNNVVAPAHGHTIHAELAEAAQRYNEKFSGWHFEED